LRIEQGLTAFDLLLIGYGNVARRFAELLDEQRQRLAREYGFRARIVGIATRHGCAYGPSVVSAFPPSLAGNSRELRRDQAEAQSANAGRRAHGTGNAGLYQPDVFPFLKDALTRSAPAARQRRLIVIETTTLDIERGEPAIGHIRTALAAGAHVITANKGPVAFGYGALARAAQRADRRFLFEGAVMDGVPIFNLVRHTLPAVGILGFRGVVNSTTNFILTAMEEDQTFEAALAEMQARGIAEADASLDVDGWDAAAKAAALANVLMGANITPRDVKRIGIGPATGTLAREARAGGRRLKLVARAARHGRRVTAHVAPEALPHDDLLAGLEGQQNALILKTDLLEEIAIVQRSGSLTQTAYALLSDLIAVARGVASAPGTRRSPVPAGRRRR
jgi:homoserine dehydrogenase